MEHDRQQRPDPPPEAGTPKEQASTPPPRDNQPQEGQQTGTGAPSTGQAEAGYAWIQTLEPEAWPAASAEHLESCRDPHTGQVDHVLGVHAAHPAGLAAHLAVYRAAMTPTAGLSGADRELLAVVVSRENGCHY